ncbi:MAG: hypothetical protein UT03_C0013G0002 [Candidatus Moranbacteria bacterium GW2011_GWD2_38_7]|nr:MAG: hypothetical protein UT03_C0013G0002 [Candidatus Moranbacteria bacterium GW2011_GWD2_38_7]
MLSNPEDVAQEIKRRFATCQDVSLMDTIHAVLTEHGAPQKKGCRGLCMAQLGPFMSMQ